MNKAQTLIAFFFAFILQVASAQDLEVISGYPITPESLIQDVFLGDGIEILDIQFEGNPASVGYFRKGSTSLNIEDGVLMSTGLATTNGAGEFGADANGIEFAGYDSGNSARDPDLRLITAPIDLNNITKYTIRFIPEADTLSFRYIFASEEYPLYVCSEYNDVFGFFISGPGINGPYENGGINIAKIPGTDLPVRINTVNNGTPGIEGADGIRNCSAPNGSLNFAHLFNDNVAAQSSPVFDGFTDVFDAVIPVEPCMAYTIKLVIADVGDTNFDSGVFLEARSFGTPALKAELSTTSTDQIIAEGCEPATLTLSLPYLVKNDYEVKINTFGSAQNKVDFLGLPETIIIPKGGSQAIIQIQALEDAQEEGQESIFFDIETNFCNRDTIEIRIRDNQIKGNQLGEDVLACAGIPIPLGNNIEQAETGDHHFISRENFSIVPANQVLSTSIQVEGLTYTELKPGVIDKICINYLEHPWVDDLDIYLVSPDGAILELSTDNGGNGGNGSGLDIFDNVCFTPSALRSITDSNSGPPYTGDYLPEGSFDLFFGGTVNGTWTLQIVDDSPGFDGTIFGWSIHFVNPYLQNYAWSTQELTESITVQSDTTNSYSLTITDSFGCHATDEVQVTISDFLTVSGLTCQQDSSGNTFFEWLPTEGAVAYEVSINHEAWEQIGDQLRFNFGNDGGVDTSFSVRPILDNMDCLPAAIQTECLLDQCEIPDFEVLIRPVDCSTETVAELAVQIEGGPYVFFLDTLSNTSGQFSDLLPGDYELRIQFGADCMEMQQVTIPEPDQNARIEFFSKPPSCPGASDATLLALVNGTTTGWEYQWSGGGITDKLPDVSDLSAGTYYLRVSNGFACVVEDSFTIADPPFIITKGSIKRPSCTGELDASALIEVEGGTAPYDFMWNNGHQEALLENIAAGNYQVTVTDINGCRAVTLINIIDPAPLELDFSVENPTCYGGAEGSIRAEVKGGLGAYSFNWSNQAVALLR